jgi:hypothetical protein
MTGPTGPDGSDGPTGPTGPFYTGDTGDTGPTGSFGSNPTVYSLSWSVTDPGADVPAGIREGLLEVARPSPDPVNYFLQKISSEPRRNLQGYWFENAVNGLEENVSRCHVYYYHPGDNSDTAFEVTALYTV